EKQTVSRHATDGGAADDAIARLVVRVAGETDGGAEILHGAGFVIAGNAETHADVCARRTGVSAADGIPTTVDRSKGFIGTVRRDVAGEIVAVGSDPEIDAPSQDDRHLREHQADDVERSGKIGANEWNAGELIA